MVCPPISEKKPNFQSDQKSREHRTNMNIILLFLAKPLDKHGITLSLLAFLWLHRPLKHDSEEAYSVNGQAIAVYLKMLKIFLSVIHLLNAFSCRFKYYLSDKRMLTNGSMKNGKSALKLQRHNRLRLQ